MKPHRTPLLRAIPERVPVCQRTLDGYVVGMSVFAALMLAIALGLWLATRGA